MSRLAIQMFHKTSGRSKHHRKLNVLISAEFRDHEVAGQTLLLEHNLKAEIPNADIMSLS
jgi:hypothetical protein